MESRTGGNSFIGHSDRSRRPVVLGTVRLVGASPPSRESGSDHTSRSTIQFPRLFTGRQLDMIAFPLGGIGTGSISLGGSGDLRDWEIYNRPAKGRAPEYALPPSGSRRKEVSRSHGSSRRGYPPPTSGARAGLGSAQSAGHAALRLRRLHRSVSLRPHSFFGSRRIGQRGTGSLQPFHPPGC